MALSLAKASSSPAEIAEVYAVLRGDPLPDDGRGFCLAHDDTNNPSCDYDRDKDVFHCKTCEASGGVLKLIVAAKAAPDLKGAMKWLVSNKLTILSDVWATVERLYTYSDENGDTLYQVGRWSKPHKAFGQRVPDGKGGWKSGKGVLDGIRRVPYRLADLLTAARDGRTVYVVEGEKDADRLRDLGLAATTNAQGASYHWPLAWASYFDGASSAVVLCDNDDAGRAAGRHRAGIIARSVADVRIVERLPRVAEKGDVSDWLDAGGDLDALAAIVADAPRVAPYEPPYSAEAVAYLVEHLSDVGNGKWFEATVGKDFRWVADRDRWYAYADGVWTPRANEREGALRAVALMRRAAEDYSGHDAEAFADHAMASESWPKLKAMLETAKAGLTIYSTVFNRGGTLLPVANGTLDLSDGTLREHGREDYITFKSSVAYDPTATAPAFERLLDEATAGPDGTLRPHLRRYLLSALAGSLEARSTQRRCYFLFGAKGTRKSTIVRTVQSILGDFASDVSYRILSEARFEGDGQGPTPGTIKLRGRRLVVASEAKEHQRLDVALIKRLIGGDGITARGLHEEEQTFRFEATLVMTGNELPRIVSDDSFWAKFKPIPFENPLTDEDPEFETRELTPELPGILALLVRAHAELRAAGYRVEDPPEVQALCAEEREQQNPLADFVRECITRKNGAKVEVPVLRDAYADFCKRTRCYQLGTRALANKLKDLKFEQKESHGKRYWAGVILQGPAALESDGHF